MISIRDVHKEYVGNAGSLRALEEVNLEVDEGEFVSVVGPSGCGKTSLLNIVAGLDAATGGEVLVGGQRVVGPSPDRGVIFQHFALFPWLTVERNIEFGLRLTGLTRPERARIVDRYLALVGLEGFRKAFPKELSGGMKQRCAIARAYALQPSILLMDEPFGSLDAVSRIELQNDLLAVWREERRTILFVTHDVEEAIYLASRVVIMTARPGRVSGIVNVDLPYPRTERTRLSEEFLIFRRAVWRQVFPGYLGPSGPDVLHSIPSAVVPSIGATAPPHAEVEVQP
jgi:NitT/TauT family transport system ATP-binding protein